MNRASSNPAQVIVDSHDAYRRLVSSSSKAWAAGEPFSASESQLSALAPLDRERLKAHVRCQVRLLSSRKPDFDKEPLPGPGFYHEEDRTRSNVSPRMTEVLNRYTDDLHVQPDRRGVSMSSARTATEPVLPRPTAGASFGLRHFDFAEKNRHAAACVGPGSYETAACGRSTSPSHSLKRPRRTSTLDKLLRRLVVGPSDYHCESNPRVIATNGTSVFLVPECRVKVTRITPGPGSYLSQQHVTNRGDPMVASVLPPLQTPR